MKARSMRSIRFVLLALLWQGVAQRRRHSASPVVTDCRLGRDAVARGLCVAEPGGLANAGPDRDGQRHAAR